MCAMDARNKSALESRSGCERRDRRKNRFIAEVGNGRLGFELHRASAQRRPARRGHRLRRVVCEESNDSAGTGGGEMHEARVRHDRHARTGDEPEYAGECAAVRVYVGRRLRQHLLGSRIITGIEPIVARPRRPREDGL